MLRFYCVILLTCLTSVAIHSQQGISYDMPEIVGQTPDVASLLKYSETSVSYSTGIPNISIPIYSLPSRELSANVSLNYHAGGHRVTEEASSVGLGWNLSAGGKITRTVKSYPDDVGSYGFIYNPYTVQFVIDRCTNGDAVQGMNCADLTGENAMNQKYDYEPDEFNYSVGGLSGKFMFNQNRTNNPEGEIVQFPFKNVKIEPFFDGQGHIFKWEITDGQGTLYTFLKGNTAYSNGFYQKVNGQLEIPQEGSQVSQYTETWDLSSIKSYGGDTILFNYDTPNLSYDTEGTFYYNEETCFEGSEALIVQMGTSTPGTDPTLPRRVSTLSCTKRTYTELTEIITSQGKIEIIRDTNFREDLESEKRRVKYFDVFDIHDNLIQRIELVHDYFVSPNSTSTQFMGVWSIGNPNDDHLYKRMYLKEVKVYGETLPASEDYKYVLEYNTNVMLPNKRSYSQDHWGYYNGALNTTLITDNVYLQSADREVNKDFAGACILKSIQYPEGGITEFVFESNQEDPDTNYPAHLEENFELQALLSNYHVITSNGGNTIYEFIEDFNIDNEAKSYQGTQQTEVNFTGFTSRCENNDAFYGSEDLICENILLKIYERNGGVIGNLVHSDNIWDAGTILLNKNAEYRAVLEITTSNGNYNFPGQNTTNNDYSEATISWLVNNTNPVEDYQTINYFGGLRIKEIKTYEKLNELVAKKVLEYKGGRILSKPTYFSVNTNNVRKYVSQSWVPLLTSQSGYVMYEEVKERSIPIVDGVESDPATVNGVQLLVVPNEIKRTFTVNAPSTAFPTAPFIFENYLGLKLSEQRFGVNTKTYEYIERSNQLGGSGLTFGFAIDRPYEIDTNMNPYNQSYGTILNCLNSNVCDISNNLYYLNSAVRLLIKEDEIKSFKDDLGVSHDVTQTKEYFYNSSNTVLNLPTSIKITSDENEIIESFFEYPDDLNNTALITSNRITQPLKTETKIDGNTTQKARVNYSTFGSDYLVDNIEAAKANNAYQQRLKYHTYNSFGKPIEVSKTDGTRIYYIYGYQNAMPIAKITNFSSNEAQQIQTLIDNAVTASNLDNDRTLGLSGFEGNLRDKLNIIRNHSLLSNSQMTTYTYDPLVGITSVTDPRGYTLYYEYDHLQRLKYVIDNDGHYLTENEYFYRN